LAAGLETIGELAGAKGQADFAIILPKKKRVVVEIKYRSVKSTDKSENIDKYLDSTLKEALKAIATKDYGGPFRLKAKDLDVLALAIYNRVKVKAAFVPKEALKR
jgi:DNA anti-recombination protein RmuC